MNNVEEAAAVLNRGGIIVFPTDTAFGIGCRIDRKDSVERLFALRRRPREKAVPVLVDSVEMAQEYLAPIPEKVRHSLMEKYWPGGLTIILPCRTEKVPTLVRGGGATIGVRQPNNASILKIIQGVGVPILGPSANFSGETTPHSLSEVDPELIRLVDYVVPGECKTKFPSTVIDCTKEPWQIVREGAVRLEL